MKHKKTILLLAGNALLLLLIGICLLRIGHYDSLLRSQQAAQAWAGQSEERFAQVSVFFPAASPENPETLRSFEQGIEKKLIDVGIEPKPQEQGRHWSSAYSAQSTLTVEGDRNRAEATVIGVGGDFFLFHPYLLASGAYLNPDDLMKDRVVLDYDLAWKLFGGASLEGMSVKIGDKPYYVAGVVHRETDKFSERAYSGEPVLYMDYSTLASLQEGLGLTSYEIAMPNPIGGFAESYLKEGFQKSKGVVLENSNRYRFSRMLRLFTPLWGTVDCRQRRGLSLLGERGAAFRGLYRKALSRNRPAGCLSPDLPGHPARPAAAASAPENQGAPLCGL